MIDNYDVKDYAVKSYCSHVRSPLARLQLQFAKVINEQILLPKLCIFILEDDVIHHLKAEEDTASTLFNAVIPWIFRQIHKLTEIRRDQLPMKAEIHLIP